MTSKAGHTFTAGPAHVGPYGEVYDHYGFEIVDATQGPFLHEHHDGNKGHWGTTPGSHVERSEDEQLANADFIAEAFTVAHETGLTPRQLAERCEKLEAALRPFQAACDYYSGEQPDEHCVDTDSVITLGQLREARAAIAMAEGGAT